MIQLIFGSLVLSILHFLIPNHWLPLVSLSRAEKWTRQETVGITIITALSHTLSTIGIGLVLGIIGHKLNHSFEQFGSLIAPVILILMGLIYLSTGLQPHTHDHLPPISAVKKRSKTRIIISLSLAMFFSPCLEVESYFLTAGSYGWFGIMLLSFLYLIVSVCGITLMVVLGLKGLKKLNWQWLDHHEKQVTGFTLVILGLTSILFKI